MSSKGFVLFILMNALVVHATSYKILVSILTPLTSHYLQGKAIADILHTRGHQVTFLNGYSKMKVPYKEVLIPEVAIDDFEMDFSNSKRSYIQKFNYMHYSQYFVEMIVKNAMESGTFQKFLKDPEKSFDLVIMDYVWNEVFFALGVKYNCPLILLGPTPMLYSLAKLTGNSVSPGTIPNYFFDFSEDMSFIERTFNTLMAVQEEYHYSFIRDQFHENAYKKYFPNEAKILSYSNLKTRVHLVFSNTYSALGSSRSYFPNIVEVGGFHLEEPDPLSEELNNLLEYKEGVVVFSMGSYLKTRKMSNNTRNLFIKCFSKLKQRVIWKHDEDITNLPSNIVVKKWIPQRSVLAHPNVRLFVFHGGVLSLTEAAASGIPLIVLPVFADQYFNSKIVEKGNIGMSMTFDELTEESFDNILQQLLYNEAYFQNAKSLQKIYLDRPTSPRDLIGFYAEHVIRTKGAKHFAPKRFDLIVSLLIDVVAVLFIIIFITLFAILKIFKRIWRMCLNKRKRKKE